MLAKKFQRSLLNCQRANRGPSHRSDRGPLKIPGCITAQRQCLPGRAYSRASSTRVNRRRRNFPKGSFSASICPGRQASFPGPSERSHQVSAPLSPKNLSAFRAFRRGLARLASLSTRAVTRWFTYLAPDFADCQPTKITFCETPCFSAFLGQLGKISRPLFCLSCGLGSLSRQILSRLTHRDSPPCRDPA